MRPWTARGVVVAMWGALRTQPLSLLVTGVLLGIWLVPATLLQNAVEPPEAPMFGRSMTAILVSWASSAWGSVWFAGQVSVSLDAVRRRAIRWRALPDGVRHAPTLLGIGMLCGVPIDVVTAIPFSDESGYAWILVVSASVGMTYVATRTSLSYALVVDRGASFAGALAMSWAATRGHTFRLVRLAALQMIVIFPVFVVEAAASTSGLHVTFGVTELLYALAVAQLHTLVELPGQREIDPNASPSDSSPSDADVRDSGTGWSRPNTR